MSHTYNGNPATFPTSITLPDDGDARNAASVDVPLEGLADRTAWLQARVVASAYVLILPDSYEPGGIAAHTWTLDYAPSENFNLAAYLSNVQAGDVFQVWSRIPIDNTGSAVRATLRIAYSYDSTTGFDGTWTELGSSECDEFTISNGISFEAQVSMHGQLTVAAGKTKVFFAVQAKGASTNISTFTSHHTDTLLNHYRPVP